MDSLLKEAEELVKIAAKSKEELRRLVLSALKVHQLFKASNSKDPDFFLDIASILDEISNSLFLVFYESGQDSAIAGVQDDEMSYPDSEKSLLYYLNQKLRSILYLCQADEKMLDCMKKEISKISTEVSHLAPSFKKLEVKRFQLRNVGLKLGNFMGILKEVQLDGVDDDLDIMVSSVALEDTVREVSSSPEGLNTDPRSANQDVAPVLSTSCSEIKLQLINQLMTELGVYNTIPLPPGSHQSLHVFYVTGTPSRFWLSIDSPALEKFNKLIKVLFLFIQSTIYLYICLAEVTEEVV